MKCISPCWDQPSAHRLVLTVTAASAYEVNSVRRAGGDLRLK